MKQIFKTKNIKGFSLLEILMAIGMISLMTVTFYRSLSSSVVLTIQSQQKTQAMWLAKAIMAQVEYQSTFLDLKSMKYEKRNQELPKSLCPNKNCLYRYNLTILPWKLDLVSIFFKQMNPDKMESNKQMISEVKKQVKASLGNELLYYALVEITWTSGIKKKSVKLPYLLTKQKELDGVVASFSQK